MLVKFKIRKEELEDVRTIMTSYRGMVRLANRLVPELAERVLDRVTSDGSEKFCEAVMEGTQTVEPGEVRLDMMPTSLVRERLAGMYRHLMNAADCNPLTVEEAEQIRQAQTPNPLDELAALVTVLSKRAQATAPSSADETP